MSVLSDLLKQHQGDRGVRAIGRACEAHGVAESTVAPYFSGRHGAPSEKVLYALAQVMPLPLTQLREAAGVPRGETEPYVAPDEANRMNQRQRDAIDDLIRAFTTVPISDDGVEPTLGQILGSNTGAVRKRPRVDGTEDGEQREQL